MEHIAVIGVGAPIVDLVASVPESFLPRIPGAKGGTVQLEPTELERILADLPTPPRKTPGGSAANTVLGLAHFGWPTALLGTLGQDDDAVFYRREMRRAGVADQLLRENAQVRSARCLSLVTPDAERTMRSNLAAALTFDPAAVSDAELRGAKLILIEGYLLFNGVAQTADLLERARRVGCRIAWDLASFEVVEHYRTALEALLPGMDLLFANADEADALCGRGAPEKQLDLLLQKVPTVVLKQGAEGCRIGTLNRRCRVPAERVHARDTTAAGDAFAVGFLDGWLRDCTLEQCGTFGAKVAAETVQVIGAALDDATWQKLRAARPTRV